MSSPDYTNMNTDAVLRDFLLRIEHYQEKYQVLDEITEKDLSYMKIYNTGEKVVVHKHEGHIQSRIVYYLMNIHITPRTIYLTRVCNRIESNFCLSFVFCVCVCLLSVINYKSHIHINKQIKAVSIDIYQICDFERFFLNFCSMVKVNTIWLD